MRAENTVNPKLYEVEDCGGIAELVLRENIERCTRQDSESEEASAYYAYDEYRMNVPFRENLLQEVEENYGAWLAAAKSEERVKAEKQTLEESVASLKADNALMAVALEEVITLLVGGE